MCAPPIPDASAGTRRFGTGSSARIASRRRRRTRMRFSPLRWKTPRRAACSTRNSTLILTATRKATEILLRACSLVCGRCLCARCTAGKDAPSSPRSALAALSCGCCEPRSHPQLLLLEGSASKRAAAASTRRGAKCREVPPAISHAPSPLQQLPVEGKGMGPSGSSSRLAGRLTPHVSHTHKTQPEIQIDF